MIPYVTFIFVTSAFFLDFFFFCVMEVFPDVHFKH